jgi:spermidine synthase
LTDVRPLRYPGTFAFIGSGGLLALALDAGRIIAPHLGSSLYTWTSVIGVVLAGLSLGNYLGGVLADRRPGRTTLSYQFLASAAAAGLVLLLSRDLDSIAAPHDWSAQLQVLWLATVLFLVPSTLLGTVTPMIVKLSLSSLDETGRVVGRIQAAASLGAITGVFLTGFLLITTFGTGPIVYAIAIVLLVLAVATSPPSLKLPQPARYSAYNIAAAAFLIVVVATVFALTYDSECDRESNYFCIIVESENVPGTGEVKSLRLDTLVHGIVLVNNPTEPVYAYERLYREVVRAKYGTDRPLKAFAIGGGTFTFPRYLERHHRANTIVAEIDPEVTDVARDEFGMRDSPPAIEVINKDARPVLETRPENERYDLVLGDAYTDLAIPYHLVTREFNELVKRHLKPDGLYLANVIDGVDHDFLRSYMKTLSQTFPHVGLLMVSPDGLTAKRELTYVVIASFQPAPKTRTAATPEAIARFLSERDTTILTDDHVPVDQLLAPLARQRLQASAEQAGI